MQRHLFLSGEHALELICEELSDRLVEAGGYITRPSVAEGGTVVGEELLPSAVAGGVEGFAAARYLDFTGGQLKKDNEVFRIEAVRLLDEAVCYPFALVGVLGGFELVIPQYRAALTAFLNSPLPCVAFLRTEEDALLLGQLLGLSDRYSSYLRQFRSALADAPNTLLLTDHDPDRAKAALGEWKASFLS